MLNYECQFRLAMELNIALQLTPIARGGSNEFIFVNDR